MTDVDSDRFGLLFGDCRERLKEWPENSFDSCVTDPPYNLASIKKRFGAPDSTPAKGRHNRGFMGKEWDSEVAFDPATWVEVLRVLKPGAHLLAFGGTRTAHRLACAIEDAGFEVRDCLCWTYGQGFAKSHDLGEGRGTALKPAFEPIYLARKPFDGTTEANVAKWGTGGLNIEACRVDGIPRTTHVAGNIRTSRSSSSSVGGSKCGWRDELGVVRPPPPGRWPANLIHDGSEEVVAAFPESAGQLAPSRTDGSEKTHLIYGAMKNNPEPRLPRGDEGSAARFFYCAKASRTDREEGLESFDGKKRDDSRNADQPSMNGGEGNPYNRGATPRKNHHPTVKPTKLMRYLVRLITPPGGVVLDPFTGSGSTGKAALLEGCSFVGCELEAEYVEIASARILAALNGEKVG